MTSRACWHISKQHVELRNNVENKKGRRYTYRWPLFIVSCQTLQGQENFLQTFLELSTVGIDAFEDFEERHPLLKFA